MPIEFSSSPRPTLGVEVELELVDRETRELVSGAHEILTEIAQALPDGEPGKAKAELLQSTIEIITRICHTVREAKHDLAASLDDLRPYTDRDGLLLMCSGTHPFSDPATQVISPDPRYQRLLERVGLAHRADVLVSRLSHGEQRELELAVALATKPQLLLLDEPMAGLGVTESARMVKLLQELRKEVTIVLVEHDMDAVFALADRISVLVYGRVIASDVPSAIRQNEDVKRAYLGDQHVVTAHV